jgi:hypothetical protein
VVADPSSLEGINRAASAGGIGLRSLVDTSSTSNVGSSNKCVVDTNVLSVTVANSFDYSNATAAISILHPGVTTKSCTSLLGDIVSGTLERQEFGI